MKTKVMNLVLAAAALIAAAACTNDDAPVPFTFIAVAPPAMTDGNTRAVPGNDTWKGDGTEEIKVRIVNTNASKSSTGIYTVISPEGKTAVLPGDEPALWPNASDQYNVYAWYPALEPTLNPGEEYDISDQSTPEKLRQADMLRAEMNGFSYDINFTPDLAFEHQMAKVRVELTGVNTSATDIEVGIWGPTRFSLSDYGYVTGDHTNSKGYINACRDTGDASTVAFEAMLPTDSNFPITKQDFIRITTGGRTYYFAPDAAAPGSLSKGEAYTYTVDIPLPPTTATASASHLSVSTPIVTPLNTSER